MTSKKTSASAKKPTTQAVIPPVQENPAISVDKIRSMIEAKITGYFGLTAVNAGIEHFYKAISITVRDILQEKRKDFRIQTKKTNAKQVYYLCMEFLVGKSLKNNIYNLGLESVIGEIISSYGYNIEDLYERDVDPGLGNGGLGRLAACFMDGLATSNYPAIGYSLRYEFGLFKQKIVDGWQIELPDEWLSSGEVWLTPRVDYTVNVKFDGYIEEKWEDGRLKVLHRDYTLVEAIPYDMMISGYNSEGVSVLRLWRAKNPQNIDVTHFSQGNYVKAVEETAKIEAITKVLYPSDNHSEGKTLRLRQQYFLVCASLQNIITRHLAVYPSLDNFHKKVAIHINDTHPTFAIPELMRILIDDYKYNWDKAWHIVRNTMAYTNHTVMTEALETWPESLVNANLPRIYSIIKEINRRLCAELWDKYTGNWEKITKMAILAYGQVRMANLCIAGGHSINGVAALHSEILKNSTFKDFYDEYPHKFTNVTNGIAHRRWLVQSNQPLSALLDECIGTSYRKQPAFLETFAQFEKDSAVLERLEQIKSANKRELDNYARAHYGIALNPDSVFNVQVKRLHEYKRQLLNVLRIIGIYDKLLEDSSLQIHPQTFIFAAKAAPSYYMAKQVIKLIYCLGEEIRRNPSISEKLNVVFLENYSVSLAEKIMPATEVSQQISLAGKEASGTGNMKAMINGAITIGTMDGANVEIAQAVGNKNIFIFGMNDRDVEQLWARQYNPYEYYLASDTLKRIIARLNIGFDGVSFNNISQYLLTGAGVTDPFMCLADFESYNYIHGQMDIAYADRERWNRMSLHNIASAGVFAADRSIGEYAKNIWGMSPVQSK